MAPEKKSTWYRKIKSKYFNSSERLFNAIKTLENESTIEALLRESVDIDARNSVGFTPLLLAARLRRRGVFKLLLKYEADVDCCGPDEWTVLHYVSLNGWTNMAQYLVKRVNNIDATSIKSATALHFASCRGFPQVVKCLIEHGADIEARTCFGATPLMCAAGWCRRNVFDILLYAGANINICDEREATVLHFATRNGWLDVVQSLVKRASDLNARDKRGHSAFLIACKYEKLDIAEYLLQEGASSKGVNSEGNSPLHYLIKMDEPNVKLIKLLIERVGEVLTADYDAIFNSSVLKVGLLQDIKFCCRVIISKFNDCDLSELYKLPVAKSLPRIEDMKIGNCCEVYRIIEWTARFEIQTKGHCNPFKVLPNVLKVLCVKSVLKYFVKKI